MLSNEHDFATLMEQIRNGSESASHELVAKYGSHILRVVRQKLNKALRSKFDSQDFVQAVWASFFAFQPDRYAFARPEELVAFLSEMARNKVIETVRQRLLTQKYNVKLERSLDQSADAETNGLSAAQPTPVEIAIAREEWQQLLEKQPALYQRILILLSGGHPRQEVAETLGLSEKTVHRVIRKLSSRQAHEQV